MLYPIIRAIGEIIMPVAVHMNGDKVTAVILGGSFAFLLYDAACRYVFKLKSTIWHLYGSFASAIGVGALIWSLYK
jgi:hypothetical protein